MNKEFTAIRKMLEEHLAAINDNTTEVQALFDYLQELEIKLEKVSQRLDQTQLSLGIPKPKTNIAPLNQMERKVFLVLYTGENLLTYQEISEDGTLLDIQRQVDAHLAPHVFDYRVIVNSGSGQEY